MGLSVEVVSSWVKTCTEAKQLDQLLTVVERQRVVLADKAAAKAKRKAGRADGSGRGGRSASRGFCA